MQGTFLGGAREVGRLALVLESGDTRLLLDYGMAPSDPPQYPKPAPPVDALLVTHAHLDHAGMAPAIAQEQRVPVYATGPTLDAAEVLCRDALKVHRLEGYGSPYQDHAISELARESRPIAWDDPFTVGSLEVQGVNSGHIPGSTMFRVQGQRSLLFTGDLTTTETHLVPAAAPVGCDTLVMEATYSGREHPDRKVVERAFVDRVEATLEQGGTAIVPSFAVGRTQELLLILEDVDADIYLDGMGGRVGELFLRHPSFLKDHRRLARVLDRVRRVRGARERRRASDPGNVVVTTSGMLDGGPVLTHLQRIADDPDSAVLLTGYQVEGTNGRRLLADGNVAINGRSVKIEGHVERFDFSGHAGHDELVRFADGCQPERIVLMHSEEPEPLIKDLESVARTVSAPYIGEPVQFT